MNDLMGSEFSNADKVSFDESTASKVGENKPIMEQIGNNTPEKVMHGDFPGAVQDALLKSSQAHEGMMVRVMENQQTADAFARLVLRAMLSGVDLPRVPGAEVR